MAVWTGDDSPEGDGAAQLLEALAAEIEDAYEERDYQWVCGGIPAQFNDDDWRPGCMCDFEGHTRPGCTHDT